MQKITDELNYEQEQRVATDAEESRALARIEELEMEVKKHELSIKRSEELLRRAEQEKGVCCLWRANGDKRREV